MKTKLEKFVIRIQLIIGIILAAILTGNATMEDFKDFLKDMDWLVNLVYDHRHGIVSEEEAFMRDLFH